MNRKTLPMLIVAALDLGISLAGAAEHKKAPVDLTKLPPASTRNNVTYERDIKPILDESCIKCHGPEKPKGKLRLDSLEGALKGGEDGKVLIPGRSAQSMLVHNIAHAGDPDDYMPPLHNKAHIPPLTREQVALIRAWIDQGAK